MITTFPPARRALQNCECSVISDLGTRNFCVSATLKINADFIKSRLTWQSCAGEVMDVFHILGVFLVGWTNI